MGKVTDKAIRIGHEETWEEFQKHHPEILIFFYNDKVVDIEIFSNNIEGFTIHKENGLVQSVLYVYEGNFVEFPPN